jgi:hypothetical protein
MCQITDLKLAIICRQHLNSVVQGTGHCLLGVGDITVIPFCDMYISPLNTCVAISYKSYSGILSASKAFVLLKVIYLKKPPFCTTCAY